MSYNLQLKAQKKHILCIFKNSRTNLNGEALITKWIESTWTWRYLSKDLSWTNKWNYHTSAKYKTYIILMSIKDQEQSHGSKLYHTDSTFMKGRKSIANNFRPINLTSLLCKLLEMLIKNKTCSTSTLKQTISCLQLTASI